MALVALLVGCGTKVGQPCKEDAECGSGFDCFRQMCVRVCTAAEQCGQGEVCQRYHCLTESGEIPGVVDRATAQRPSGEGVSTGPQVPNPAAAPNTTAAELRAIRRELELVREQQAAILELLEGKGKRQSK